MAMTEVWWDDQHSLVQFAEAFRAEVEADAERSGMEAGDFRAGGRVSKAWPNREDGPWWLANGPVMVDSWISFREGLPNWIIWTTPGGEPAIELAMNASVGGVPVRAYLDRIFVDESTGELALVDLKTGSREPDNALQLGFYRVLVQKTLDVEINTGYYWMARKGSLSVAHDLTRFDEHLIGSLLQQFERALQDEVFIPHLTSLCSSCSVNRACHAYGGAEAQAYDVLHPDYKPVIKTLKENP